MGCSYICNKNKCHPNSSLKSATPFPRPLDLSLVLAHTSTIAFSFYLTWQEANLLQQFFSDHSSNSCIQSPLVFPLQSLGLPRCQLEISVSQKGIPHNRKIIQTNFSYLYIYVFLTLELTLQVWTQNVTPPESSELSLLPPHLSLSPLSGKSSGRAPSQ